jgi:RNA polymerase sigma-70 factor, ECF subfamily
MTATGGARGPYSGPSDADESNGLAQHLPVLRAVAESLCRDADTCKDLVQDTFERALRHISGVHEPVRNTRAWMVTILRNAFYDRLRCERATSSRVDDCEAPEPEPPPAWADVTLADVRAACAAIDPDLRIVFELHYLDGLRYRDIATRLHIPENTVASRLFRARKALRDQLLASTTCGGEPS